MRNLLLSLFLIVSTILAVPAIAAVSASTKIHVFSSTNVTTTYTQLFSAAQVVKAIKGASLFNSSTTPIILAFGAAGFEVDQLTVPPGGSTTVGPSSPIYYPLVASQNTRISMHTSTGTVSTGSLITTLFYN